MLKYSKVHFTCRFVRVFKLDLSDQGKKHGWDLFGNRVLRIIFGPKRDKMT
jgi:hypothetical protein